MYSKKVIGTPPIQAASAVKLLALDAYNRKRAGNALHNAVVNAEFTYQPDQTDAVNQVPDSFAPAVTHAEAITKMNALRPFLLAHFADATYAHYVADTANAAVITEPDATDVPTLSALLVQYRTAVNQHFANDDAHNRIILTPAIMTVPVDSATNIAVCNAILRNYEGHVHNAAVSLSLENI